MPLNAAMKVVHPVFSGCTAFFAFRFGGDRETFEQQETGRKVAAAFEAVEVYKKMASPLLASRDDTIPG